MKLMMSYFRMCVCLSVGTCVEGANAFGGAPPILEKIQSASSVRSVSGLTALAVEIEPLWTNDAALYFKACDCLGEALEPLSGTNLVARKELERVCERALRRKCPTNFAVADSCFKSKLQIAQRLPRAFQTLSIRHAEVLANFLGEVRTVMITNYQPVMVPLNVYPPIHPTDSEGVPTFTFAGMNPKAIRDPKARAAYEQAIAESDQKNCENVLQTLTIPEVNYALTQLFVQYSKRVFAQNPENSEQAIRLARAARLTTAEEQLLQSSLPSPELPWFWEHSPR